MKIFKMKTIMMGLLLVAMLSLLVSAAKNDTGTDGLQNAKNMTYGQCVSVGAEAKNTCYDTVKAAKEACREQAINATDSKIADKTCKTDYKAAMKQCKADFKRSKQECKKIKHNVFETIGSSMK